MKAHIGVDADTGLAHTVVGATANVNDVTHALDKGIPMGAIPGPLSPLIARMRAKVERQLRLIQRQLAHVKVCDQEQAKSTTTSHTMCTRSSLWMVRFTSLERALEWGRLNAAGGPRYEMKPVSESDLWNCRLLKLLAPIHVMASLVQPPLGRPSSLER